MKRRSIIALLLVLALCLAGCGGKSEPQGGTVKPLEETKPAATQEQTEPEVTEEVTEAPTVPEKELSIGSMEGGVYENTYTGYGCKLNDTWVYKSAEEIQDISALTKDLLEGSEIDEKGADLPQFTDMLAENAGLMASINVQYTYLTVPQRLIYATLSESDVLDATLAQKDMIISSYAQAGIDVSSMEKVTVTFLGEERSAIYTQSTVQGVNYYILQIMDINLGEYYVTLTLGSFVDDNTGAMLDLFYPVN